MRDSRKGASRATCGKNRHLAVHAGYTFHAWRCATVVGGVIFRFSFGVPLPIQSVSCCRGSTYHFFTLYDRLRIPMTENPSSASVDVDSATVTAKSFTCNACGTPLKIPKNSKGHVQCPSCRNDCVLEGLAKNAEIAAKENITGGIPLTASPTTLHRQLVSALCASPDTPLDAFDKIEVLREERYCVPAYLFDCNGTTSFTYDKGVEKEETYTVDRGDRVEVRTKYRTEWYPQSGNANVMKMIFAPGNKERAQEIQQLYGQGDAAQLSNQLMDIEELNFPPDVETLAFNLPQNVAFSEHVAPQIEKMLEKKARDSVTGTARNFITSGSRIDKDVKRIFLGLYRVVYRYGDKEYSMWATGEGKKITQDKQPFDQQRQKIHDQKLAAVKSIPPNYTGGLTFGLVACAIAAIAAIGSPLFLETPFMESLIVGLAFAGGAVVCGMMLPSASKVGKERDEDRAKAQKELDDFASLLPNAVQRFKGQKKALNGIYSGCSGDAKAF